MWFLAPKTRESTLETQALRIFINILDLFAVAEVMYNKFSWHESGNFFWER
jgi:hypothetical protein